MGGREGGSPGRGAAAAGRAFHSPLLELANVFCSHCTAHTQRQIDR